MKKGITQEYTILRVIAILLVVIGHSAYFSIGTKYGGINYSEVFNPSGKAYSYISFIIGLIYYCHMPIFVFISGALFYKSTIGKNKRYGFKELLDKKVERLLIPYFLVGILFMIPVKYIGGFYTNNNILKAIVSGLVISEDSGHLWFLYMLFIVFVIFFFIDRHIGGKNRLKIFLILFIVYYLADKMPVNILESVHIAQYLIWFYTGYLFESKRDEINSYIESHSWKVCLMFFILYLTLSEYIMRLQIDMNMLSSKIFYKSILFLVAGIGIFMLYTLAFSISKSKICQLKLVRLLDQYNFDIYLFHDPINYLILAIISRLNMFGRFETSIGYIGFICIRIIVPIALSIIISIAVRRVNDKIKYLGNKKIDII